jgi:hypothetical protein
VELRQESTTYLVRLGFQCRGGRPDIQHYCCSTFGNHFLCLCNAMPYHTTTENANLNRSISGGRWKFDDICGNSITARSDSPSFPTELHCNLIVTHLFELSHWKEHKVDYGSSTILRWSGTEERRLRELWINSRTPTSSGLGDDGSGPRDTVGGECNYRSGIFKNYRGNWSQFSVDVFSKVLLV